MSAEEPVVLLTAFSPFQGRAVNGSETVARSLEGQIIAGARIKVLLLPVHWGAPERLIPPAVAALRPVLLLGLGEAAAGEIRIERCARNHARGLDMRQAPPPTLLETEGPQSRSWRLPCNPSWFVGSAIPVRVSDEVGAYLCNSLFYTALAQPVDHVGFVHVPPQEAVAAGDAAAYVQQVQPVIITLLAAAIVRRAG